MPNPRNTRTREHPAAATGRSLCRQPPIPPRAFTGSRIAGIQLPRITGMIGAVALAVIAAAPIIVHTTPAAAQTGGSSGGGTSGGGGSAGSPGASPGAGPGVGGATGTGVPSAQSPSPAMPAPPSGPQVNTPANPPSTVPDRNTGLRPVPSAGNAEPNSPIYRQDREASPAGRVPSGDPTAAGNRQPQTGEIPNSTGGTAGNGASSGASGAASDDLGGTQVETTKAPSSISDEPNRIKRGGGAAGADMKSCMDVWDSSTHMTKEQWRTTCKRLGR